MHAEPRTWASCLRHPLLPNPGFELSRGQEYDVLHSMVADVTDGLLPEATLPPQIAVEVHRGEVDPFEVARWAEFLRHAGAYLPIDRHPMKPNFDDEILFARVSNRTRQSE